MTKESKGVFTRPVYASPCLISGTFIGRIMKRSKHYRPEQLFIALPSRSVWHKRCAHWNNWPRILVCRMDSRPGSLGATVLFIVRYCKEATGGLDDAQSRLLAEHLHKLEERRTSLGAQKFSRTWKPN